MAEHTPGPWTVSEDDPTAIWATGHYIAEAFSNAAANVPLITAAPDMYQALAKLDDWWTADFPGGPNGDRTALGGMGRLSDETCKIWRQIRSAIAKAEAR